LVHRTALRSVALMNWSKRASGAVVVLTHGEVRAGFFSTKPSLWRRPPIGGITVASRPSEYESAGAFTAHRRVVVKRKTTAIDVREASPTSSIMKERPETAVTIVGGDARVTDV